MVRSGCPWRYLPTGLPPWQTVYWYFQQWEQAGVTETLLAELRIKARRQAGREDEPSAGIIDSQSVKGADTVGRDSRGYEAGKKVNGRKRFIITDTTGEVPETSAPGGAEGVVRFQAPATAFSENPPETPGEPQNPPGPGTYRPIAPPRREPGRYRGTAARTPRPGNER